MHGQNNLPNFNIAFVGQCVWTNVTSIGTTYNVTSGYEYVTGVYYNAWNIRTF